ncbi:hypothetical protein [Lysobacter arvi]|uniref:HMA domain-containing protein n=1 Tax=Lysobacter arvi TaxID=3038776 RepID=A0ABU1CER1_9GAMM|nr:hypothetical protein [Lysobacter arvi]MDR0183399.1 hypothetical protein [Lysobacter arvi]
MIAAHPPQSLDEREARITRALQEFDPEAVVAIEANGGRLSISTVLDELEVIAILGGLGVDAAPKRTITDDGEASSHPVGGCGCGCG